MEKIAQNLEKITNSINSATSANEVKIIAVSKSHSFDTVNKAIESGVFCFGENKVKECKEKYKLENYRMAAYAIALKKIEKSYLELGI